MIPEPVTIDAVVGLLKSSEAEFHRMSGQLRAAGLQEEAQRWEQKAKAANLASEWILQLKELNP